MQEPSPRRAPSAGSAAAGTPLQKWQIALFATAFFLVLGGGAALYVSRERAVVHHVESELDLISRSKADQIVQWRAERLSDGAALRENPAFSEAVERWLLRPGTDNAAVDAGLGFLRIHGQYDDVLLVDGRKQTHASLTGNLDPLSAETLEAVSSAWSRREPVLTELYSNKSGKGVLLDVVTPFFDQASRPLAAIVLRNSARQFIYPVIGSWPMPSETAEVSLVRRDGEDGVLVLNELRHQPNTALRLRLPLSRVADPAVMAVNGRRGVFTGIDYRGGRVMASLEAIPNSRLAREALKDGKVANNLHVATDGTDALDFLRSQGRHAGSPRPDVILLDLNLPGKDGREVLAEIKEDPEPKRIPVVVLTTSQAGEDVLRSNSLHANCYIQKPLDFDPFISVVQSIEHFWLTIVTLPRCSA